MDTDTQNKISELESILFLVEQGGGDKEFRELDIMGLGPDDKQGRIIFIQRLIINELKR